MVGFRIEAGSFGATVSALSAASDPHAVIDALGEALADVLYREVTANLSYTDHSLADLRKLDHPYARRHGSIQVHGDGQRVVHKRSGDMLRSLRVESLPSANSPTGQAWAVWFDVGESDHARFVVLGTKYMLPRDVLWATCRDPRVQREFMRATVATLGKALRTKANIRFTS